MTGGGCSLSELHLQSQNDSGWWHVHPPSRSRAQETDEVHGDFHSWADPRAIYLLLPNFSGATVARGGAALCSRLERGARMRGTREAGGDSSPI